MDFQPNSTAVRRKLFRKQRLRKIFWNPLINWSAQKVSLKVHKEVVNIAVDIHFTVYCTK